MYGVVEFSIVPLGTGNSSVSDYVRIALNILQQKGYTMEFHAMGTNIEGSIDKILDTIMEINKKFETMGVKRIVTTIKIDYRVDKISRIEEKKSSVINKK